MAKRLRVYQAEDTARAICPAPLPDEVSAQEYVDGITESLWWVDTLGTLHPRERVSLQHIEVQTGRGGRSTFYWTPTTYWRGHLVHRIRLGVTGQPPSGVAAWEILHELAHCLALYDGSRGHNRLFAWHLTRLVGEWLGAEHAAVLKLYLYHVGVPPARGGGTLGQAARR